MSRTALHTLVQDEAFHHRIEPVRLNSVRRRGREGSALLGRVLLDYANKHDTVAEVVGCALLREVGIHDLEPNAAPEPWLTPADALIRAARLALDINGSVHSTAAKRRTDAAKALDYANAEHLLLPVTNEEVFVGGLRWARRIAALADGRRAQFRDESA